MTFYKFWARAIIFRYLCVLSYSLAIYKQISSSERLLFFLNTLNFHFGPWTEMTRMFRAISIALLRCLTPQPYGWPRGYVGHASHFGLPQELFDFEPLPTVEGVWCRLITHSYECLVIMEAQRVLEWKKSSDLYDRDIHVFFRGVC